MNINNIGSIESILNNLNSQKSTEEKKENTYLFENYLRDSLQKTNDLQLEAERQSNLLATGQVENIHDVTIASAKAKISLDLTMAVRNKVVEAYKEIMRMQV